VIASCWRSPALPARTRKGRGAQVEHAPLRRRQSGDPARVVFDHVADGLARAMSQLARRS
jgi:hypothetical protein